ncbi:MAG: subclass B3 metallo-beta-lactamase [Acidobacteriota bacterium]|nr:subclass B3 metallo-beta-lactamase [Acidobacteriota bacterium]
MTNRRTLCALLCVCLSASAAEKFSPRRLAWNKPTKPFHIIGNIYFVGTAGLGSYLITTPDGDIILDAGLPESAPLIEKNVAALGFHMKDVKYLLNSHAHYDHAGGLAQLKKDSGARMVASRADAETLNSGMQSSYGGGWDSKFPAVKVDRIIKTGDKVELGGTTLTALLTPGHTKGCTTWTMPVTEAGKTYSVIFYCSTSVPGYPLVHNREYPQIASDYQHSFDILKNVKADVFLANHAEFFHMKEKLARLKPGAPNPFIDPGELHKYVLESEQAFNRELSKQQMSAKPPLH